MKNEMRILSIQIAKMRQEIKQLSSLVQKSFEQKEDEVWSSERLLEELNSIENEIEPEKVKPLYKSMPKKEYNKLKNDPRKITYKVPPRTININSGKITNKEISYITNSPMYLVYDWIKRSSIETIKSGNSSYLHKKDLLEIMKKPDKNDHRLVNNIIKERLKQYLNEDLRKHL